MANTILLPYTIITNPHTPKRRPWRRYSTTMTINTTAKPPSHIVHNSTSHLPDIVNDCHRRRDDLTHPDHQMKLTCKQIAHSLRLVADQVDRKYCQDTDFNRDLHCLSLRLVFHTMHLRTILYTLWTRSFLPFLLMVCKSKSFL